MADKPVKVRQADWVSTTAKWGCGTILVLLFAAWLLGNLAV